MCIDEQLLSAYLDGELGEPYKTQVSEHLSYCPACRTRLEKMKGLSATLQETDLSSSAFDERKGETFELLEKKYFDGKQKNTSFFRRKIELGLPSLVTAAAAVVIVFIGGFVLFGSNSKQTEEILPSFSVQADSNNLRFVSQQKKGLESYSLEEILQYLDSKGYDVDISIKGLKPLDVATPAVTE